MDSKGGSVVPLILSIIAVLIAVIGVVIAAVGLTRSGTTNVVIDGMGGSTAASNTANQGYSNDDDDEKVWLFSIGHYDSNTGYLDDSTGTIKGFDVDIPNAVCRIAGKNCQFVEDPWNNCWDSTAGQSPRPGKGLMGRYYDACTAWLQTTERLRSVRFTDPFAAGVPSVLFAVKTGNPTSFSYRDISGKVIGFADGWAFDEHCVARDPNIGGTPIATENIKHFPSVTDMIAAIVDGSIDAGFGASWLFEGAEGIDLLDEYTTKCEVAGSSMMMRKDSTLWKWWNPAFEKLLKSPEYRLICEDLKGTHGHVPGHGPEICLET